MEKFPPPLLGFNNNVRHRGQVFHIQTEDSGVKHARIMTHLFADGGRIVQSSRTDYGEHLGRDDMVEVVRRMMKDQHKAMFVRLRAGVLDAQIESACGPLPSPAPQRPATVTEPDDGRAPERPPHLGAKRELASPASEPSATSTESPLPPTTHVAATARAGSLSNPGLRRVVPSVAPPANGELDFDAGSLDEDSPTPADPRRDAALAPPRVPGRGPETEDDGRYAHPRPATIFGEIPQPGSSIFGGEMSEKSLDEVILSYLADDFEEDP